MLFYYYYYTPSLTYTVYKTLSIRGLQPPPSNEEFESEPLPKCIKIFNLKFNFIFFYYKFVISLFILLFWIQLLS